jgi:hypothetical protein
VDGCGWFVEGLAVHVSGQVERSRPWAARDAFKSGKRPANLAAAWSDRCDYGVCGSMVEFVDNHFGRDVVKKLPVVVTNEEALHVLKTTEGEFLEEWRAYVRKKAATFDR